MEKRPKISVVIVNYNVKYFLEQCLFTVMKATNGMDREIFVFDNNSSDGSVEYLKMRYPIVTFISSMHNLGFAKGNNVAIRQSKGEYVLLLNPDTFIGENVIADTIAFMDEHPDAGACGVMMHAADGSFAPESRRGLPTIMTSFLKMIGKTQRYYMSYLPKDEVAKIDVVSGAYCMLRRETLDKVGLLDTEYFMYGEDIDLSYRVTKGGYNNYYLPLKILHYKGESTKKTSFRYVHVFYKAMLIFFRKYYGHLSFIVTIPIKLAIFFKAIVAYIYLQCGRLKKQLGLLDMVREDSEYLFIGSDDMTEECMKIARKRGLAAKAVVGNDCTMPDGHHALMDLIDSKVETFVVYDTGSYSYRHILDIISKSPNEKIRLGTFSLKTGMIITEKCIIS
ncbi:MAG: glycosyltransferase family 2 protein [Prevotellaceae bacterium]|nr:glycosyltransferase family 2 protein [Prevotellaceae bacterium]